jgi:precorrin-2 dehydrogenase / sirohydrochlorin ferrochelatase
MKNLFPMFLKLEKRACLVVGAGSVGESKIASLLTAGASIRVVAPEATELVQSWARKRKVAWQKREFRSSDLAGVFLIVAATSSTALHKRIYREAQRRGVLCNVVDVPRLCDFYYPAVVRRGALQIAISTAGRSPALAQRLRKELEKQFGPEYEDWLDHVGNVRDKVQGKKLDAERRKELLHLLVSKKGFNTFLKANRKPRKRHK